MFRTALVRTAAAAARRAPIVAARSFSAVPRPALSSVVKRQAVAPAVASKIVVRGYASGGGLSKEDAEGRIMSLLAGFDKVSRFVLGLFFSHGRGMW